MTIGLIGDSTVASTYGWGPAFAEQVTDQVTVLNYAKNGATLESLSKRLDELLLLRPDYVFIQFGHNDQKKYDTTVYSDRLRSYIERVKAAGGQAVVFSSVTRRVFDEEGKIEPRESGLKANLSFYADAARKAAEAEKVPFIDLYTVSVAHHNRIGPDASAAYNFKSDDTTHFSPEGADAIAALIVTELRQTVPELAPYLKQE